MRAAIAVALVALAAPAFAAGGVHIHEDDWERALAEAKARDQLLFVDAWAPW